MWDEAYQNGVDIATDEWADILGVPVIPTVATEGVGVDELQSSIDQARSATTTDKCRNRNQQLSIDGSPRKGFIT